MASAKVIILEYVCPAMGTIFANMMFYAPYGDLQRAIARTDLGDLNPTPWAFMLGNCFGWVLYGILMQNLWIFFANVFGFILSVWLNMGAVKMIYQGHHSVQMRKSFVAFLENQEKSERTQENSVRELKKNNNTIPKDWVKIVWDVTSQTTLAPTPHENLVMGMVLVWTCCASVIAFATSLPASTKQFIVGLLVNLNLVFFYGAPLSTILQILRERNTASLHIPTMITNTLNGSFWTAYGIAIVDYWIIVPNGLGAAVGGIQFILCLIFPRTRRGATQTNKESPLEVICGTKQEGEDEIEMGCGD